MAGKRISLFVFLGRTSVPRLFSVALVTALVFAACQSALAVPVSFTVTNPSSSNQSRIDISATATLSGVPLTSGPEVAPGGSNGKGSESTLYAQTSTNTPSNIATTLGPYDIGFTGGGTAQAANATGSSGNNLTLTPGPSGATSGPGDYGVAFSSQQSIAIPPIDISSLNLGLTTLNLGTLTGINLNVALRDVSLDFHSGIIPMSGGGGYPAQFDSSQVSVSISGTSDILLTATLTQDNILDWLATGVALSTLQSSLAAQNITITDSGNIGKLSYQVGFAFSTPIPATEVANTNGGLGTVDHVGSNLQVTLPVKFDIQPTTLPAPLNTLLAADITMSGQLIGTAPFQAVPEPASCVLAFTGIIGLVVLARQRRRQA